MKNYLLLFGLVLLSPLSFAYGVHPYVGVNAGYGYVDINSNDFAPSGQKHKRDGIAWGANIGMLLYQTPNFAIGTEFGYNQLGSVKNGGNDYMRHLRVGDVLLKGVLYGHDETYKMDLYAKVGVAQVSFDYNTVSSYVRKYSPMFVLGTNYHATDHILITLEANATLASGSRDSAPPIGYAPAFYWATAGITYVF